MALAPLVSALTTTRDFVAELWNQILAFALWIIASIAAYPGVLVVSIVLGAASQAIYTVTRPARRTRQESRRGDRI